MDGFLVALAVFAMLLLVLGLGIWIFAGLIVLGIVSLHLLAGFPLQRIGAILQPILWRNASGWELAAIPMFVWMGEIMFRTDLSARIFRGLSPFLHRVPGRLLHTNVLGCTLFAALCGSSPATTATVGKITMVALRERGYPLHLAMGSLAGAGSLGLLIPPSIVLIIYGILAEVSIARLFIAGFLPGLLIAFLYSLYLALLCLWRPHYAPAGGERYGLLGLLRGVVDLSPVLALIVIVLGGIYTGWATPSEAAALGVSATLLFTLVTGQLTLPVLQDSLMGSVRTSAMVCSILMAAAFLSTVMGYLHVPMNVARVIGALDLPPYLLILALAVFFVCLGFFLEGLSITVMTLPITLPLVQAAGFSPLWFGIFLVVMVELAQVPPPVGFNLFVLQGLTGRPIGEVAIAAFPFFLLMCLGAAIITAFPEIVLWLPRVLMG